MFMPRYTLAGALFKATAEMQQKDLLAKRLLLSRSNPRCVSRQPQNDNRRLFVMDDNPQQTKKCSACGEIKLISDFYTTPNYYNTNTVYHMGICKKCSNVSCQERYHSPEGQAKAREYGKIYRQSPNGKEALKRGIKKYYQTPHGKEMARFEQKKYKESEHGKQKRAEYEKTLEVRQRRSAWKKTEAGKLSIANYNHRRRINKNQSDYRLTQKDWDEILECYNHSCAYCKTPNITLTIEHVIPLSRGGTHTKDNLIPACTHCNYSKQDKLIGEWKPEVMYGDSD